MTLRWFSLSAAALVVGGLLVWAVTSRFAVSDFDVAEGAVIAQVTPPPPASAPPDRAPPPQAQPPQHPQTVVPDATDDPTEAAASATPAEVAVSNPTWLRRPTSLARFYPASAFMQGVAGDVELDCLVETDGRLDCAVVSETPPNAGFGQAALRIADEYRMAPLLLDGRPARGRLRMNIPFRSER